MTALAIPVDGMACEKCASRVQRTLVAIDGVGDAVVSLEQKRVVVHFDPHRTSPATLVTAIDGAGFKAGAPSEAR
jgi:copper chaperone CopZ